MKTGFSVVAIAGRDSKDGIVKVLRQEVLRSNHNDRVSNMKFFAESAAKMATEVIGQHQPHQSNDDTISTSTSLSKSELLRIDRATKIRGDPEKLLELEKYAKFVIVSGPRVLVQSASPTTLATLDYSEKQQLLGEARKRQSFLGLLSQNAVFGIDLLEDKHDKIVDKMAHENYVFVDTRTTAPLFSSLDNELALHATALSQFQRRTVHCTLCGGKVQFVDAGTSCQCEVCNNKFWPRQDPSMIALISSRDGSRVLLAHSKRHPPKLHTVLAGFVEAGETLEAAVARETWEETGICVDEGSVQYVSSQPWPFPQSSMVGFVAKADDTQPIVIDDAEIVQASWFHRSDVVRAAQVPGATMQKSVAELAVANDPNLKLLIPPKGVIARKLIDLWLDRY
jgi:NAD+ diphosphatase